jgi:hypothetical protein
MNENRKHPEKVEEMEAGLTKMFSHE